MDNVMEVMTQDDLKYQWFPVSSGSISFKVRAAHDAHLALTMDSQESQPMIEVFIGGWSNTKSVIRKNKQQPEKDEAQTENILNGGEYRGFWVRWDAGIIQAGREGEAIAFLSWQDPEPFPVRFVGVCTGWGASGTWKIEAQPSAPSVYPNMQGAPGVTPAAGGGAGVWANASGGQVPPGAVVGGQDCSGEPLYVARANHEGAMLPGKLVASHGCAYVPWGGGEHGKPEYQVLVGGPGNWVPTSGAALPAGVVPAGESEEGEPLFVGRVHHEGSITTGKVQQSHGVCYIAFGGQELGFADYEVLVA